METALSYCHYGTCGIAVNEMNLRTNKPYHYCQEHTKMRRDNRAERYIRNKDNEVSGSRTLNLKIKMHFLKMYGSICQCCGESDQAFLSLDHIHGGGTQHRKTKTGMAAHREAIANYNPAKYRILCHNCNFAHGVYGSCPHVTAVSYEREQFLDSDSINTKNLKRIHNLRVTFFEMYEDKCNCCGESNRAFLSLDHICGGGNLHRGIGNNYGIYKDTTKEHQSHLYQILCYNCNFSKGTKQTCPHNLLVV